MSKNIKNITPSDLLLKIRIAIASGREDLLPELNDELKNTLLINKDHGE